MRTIPACSKIKFKMEELKEVIFFFLWSATAKYVSPQTSRALCWASKASGIFLLFNSQSFGKWGKAMQSAEFIQNVLVRQAITWCLVCLFHGREVAISYTSDFFSNGFNWGYFSWAKLELTDFTWACQENSGKIPITATTEVWGPLPHAALSATGKKKNGVPAA